MEKTPLLSHLPSVCMVLFLISAQEFGQAEVGDLHVLRGFHQNVACGQIPVHQVALFQVVHPLK